MSLFGRSERKIISLLESELEQRDRRISQLESLCKEKDSFFLSAISDGLRHGSPDAGKHMADRKKYLQGKY